nr:nuclear pore complex protein NUP1-like isoform X2 [Tanacetum cinerariifolium]
MLMSSYRSNNLTRMLPNLPFAKAYMGTRPTKVSSSTLRLGSQAPRQDSVLLNNTTILPRMPITSLAPKLQVI